MQNDRLEQDIAELPAQPRIVFEEYTPEDYEAARTKSSFSMSQEELEAFHLHPFPAGRFDEKGFPGLWPATEKRLRMEPFKTIEEFDRAVIDKAVSLCRKFANDNFGIFCMTESTDDNLWAYFRYFYAALAGRYAQQKAEHSF